MGDGRSYQNKNEICVMNGFRNHLATRTRLDELRLPEIALLDRLAPAIAPEGN